MSSEPPLHLPEVTIDKGQDWRPPVLETVLCWSVRVGAIIACLLLVVAGLYTPDRLVDPDFLVMFAVYGAMVVLHKKTKWPLRRRVVGFCLVLATLAALGIYQFGFAPVPLLSLALAVICAGLFLGPRSLITTLVLTTLLIGGVGMLCASGDPSLSVQWLDARSPASWIRASIEYAAVAGAIAALVAHVVKELEAAHLRTAAALDELQVETLSKHGALDALAESEAALIRAQRLEALGRLAAGVGHDFNNTLQVILSSASHLSEENDLIAVRQGLEEIVQAATHGRELPKRLLAFGRQDTPSPKSLDPQQMIAKLLNPLRRLLPESIELEDSLQSTGAIWVDPAQFEQVLFNAVLNARDAMPQGGCLQLGTGRMNRNEIPASDTDTAQTWAHVWISDNGTGIPDEVRDRIFEPFFTTKGSAGTGLGLATAYGIVKRSSGVIAVDSREGKGTTLHLYFPEHVGEITSTVTEECALPPGLSVLLVEDDLSVQRGMNRVLRAAGCHVIACDRADAALEEMNANQCHFDLLCTDGLMPGGGVANMIDQYRQRNPAGEVLVCSGYLPEELLKQEISAGTLEYLAKPFLPTELIAHISRLLQNSQVRKSNSLVRRA